MKVSCEADAQGSLGRAWKQMSWLYYQYLLVTALYMLEPWERTIFMILISWGGGLVMSSLVFPVAEACTYCPLLFGYIIMLFACLGPLRYSYSMLVSIIGMALYTGYIFMPQHILAILHYFEIVQ